MTFVTTDIDECKKGKICPGKQNCVNEVGSYRCSCYEGYHMVEELESYRCLCNEGHLKVEEVCVPNSPASQSSLTIYLAVGEYIYSTVCLYRMIRLLHEMHCPIDGWEEKDLTDGWEQKLFFFFFFPQPSIWYCISSSSHVEDSIISSNIFFFD